MKKKAHSMSLSKRQSSGLLYRAFTEKATLARSGALTMSNEKLAY